LDVSSQKQLLGDVETGEYFKLHFGDNIIVSNDLAESIHDDVVLAFVWVATHNLASHNVIMTLA
jgi:hypothetical protein